MNYSVIKRIIGWLLVFESFFLLVPACTAVIYEEWETLESILSTLLLCLALGGVCMLGKPKNPAIYAKEGMVIVALSWIVLSLFGALPFGTPLSLKIQ